MFKIISSCILATLLLTSCQSTDTESTIPPKPVTNNTVGQMGGETSSQSGGVGSISQTLGTGTSIAE